MKTKNELLFQKLISYRSMRSLIVMENAMYRGIEIVKREIRFQDRETEVSYTVIKEVPLSVKLKHCTLESKYSEKPDVGYPVCKKLSAAIQVIDDLLREELLQNPKIQNP